MLQAVVLVVAQVGYYVPYHLTAASSPLGWAFPLWWCRPLPLEVGEPLCMALCMVVV